MTPSELNKYIIEIYAGKKMQFESTLKNASSIIYSELLSYTDKFSPKTFAERLYIVQKHKPPIFPCGNKPVFIDPAKGYGVGCKLNCPCAKAYSVVKNRKTCMERYDCINSFQSEAVKNKSKESMISKFGVDNPSKCVEIQARKKITWIEKYGVDNPMKSETVLDKCKETNLIRYGYDNPMKNEEIKATAKKNYLDLHGCFPLEKEEIRNKGKDVLKTNTGYEYNFQNPNWHKQVAEELFEEHGVRNNAQLPTSRKKISDKKIEQGATPIDKRDDKKLYYDAVWTITRRNWSQHKNVIDPDNWGRTIDRVLDHNYSIHQGFINNIPPYIIGHWSNLRIITKSENSKKSYRCDKTQEQLFEDFFNNQ